MEWYRESLGADANLRLNREAPHCRNVYWMICLEMRGITESQRVGVMKELRESGVDSQPDLYPVPGVGMYQRSDTPVAHEVSPRGMDGPARTPELTQADVAQIGEAVREVLVALRM